MHTDVYIYTYSTGWLDVCIHNVGGGVEFRQSRKVQEVLSLTISCGLPRKLLSSQTSLYTRFLLSLTSCFWLRECSTSTKVQEKEKERITFRLSLCSRSSFVR